MKQVFMLLFFSVIVLAKEYSSYTIGVVANSKEHVHALKLLEKQVNDEGGIYGKEVRLKLLYDRADTKQAIKAARHLAQDNTTLAVIGHSYSSTSIAASRIYKRYKLPVITASATNNTVTSKNPWYFRTVYSDRLVAKLSTNYIKNILKNANASIIYFDSLYGRSLQRNFLQASREIGLQVENSFRVRDDLSKEAMQAKLASIQALLLKKTKEQRGVIFIAGHSKRFFKVIQSLRDGGIENTLFLSNLGVSDNFLKELSQSQKHVVYTNKLLAAVPFIFDAADQNAQAFYKTYVNTYKQEPNAYAPFYYDSLKLLLEAIKKSNIQNTTTSNTQDREKIRAFLASLNSLNNTVKGVSNVIYFDKNGDANQMIKVAEVKGGKVVSAPVQFNTVKNVNEVLLDLEKKLESKRLLEIDGKYFKRTDIVYTGVNLKNIYKVDLFENFYDARFQVWFRSAKEITLKDINFENMIKKPHEVILKSSKQKDGFFYKLYEVSARFEIDTIAGVNVFKEHALGIQYHHKSIGADRLIFVKDFLGLDSELEGFYENEHFLRNVYGWRLKNISYFSSAFDKSSAGNTKYIKTTQPTVAFSLFNMKVSIVEDRLQINQLLHKHTMLIVLIVSLLFLMLHTFFLRSKMSKRFKSYYLVLQYLNVMVILVTLKGCIIEYYKLLDFIESMHIRYTITFIDILFYFLTAHFFNLGLKHYLTNPRDGKIKTPKLVRRLFFTLTYTLAFFAVLSQVLHKDITALLATSGVLAMVIGMAVQSNISNIFTGLAINVEKPFEIGDDIEVKSGGKSFKGKIVDVTWRCIYLEQDDGSKVSIPNHVLTSTYIKNDTKKYKKRERLTLDVLLPVEYDPKEVRTILQAAVDAIKGFELLGSSIKIVTLNDEGILYAVNIDFLQKKDEVALSNAFWENLWYALQIKE